MALVWKRLLKVLLRDIGMNQQRTSGSEAGAEASLETGEFLSLHDKVFCIKS